MATASDDLQPEAYYDDPWPKLLPWLSGLAPESTPELAVLAPSPDWWLTESPAVTTMAVEHGHLCRRLAEAFINRHLTIPLDEGFPTLPTRLPLVALAAGARARTAFQRLDVRTVGELGRLTARDLYDVRGTGQGTVEDIVAALVSAAITRPAALGAAIWEDAGDARTTAPVEQLPPAQTQLLEDLRQLTEWWHLRGHSDQPLFDLVIEDGAPEQLQDAVQRINSLTASDIVRPEMPAAHCSTWRTS
ncbi:hypothetical protein [Micromonospora sp. LOL_027]|uniref:hypothetical protein n=1 Tax=Micromonospora sp. LOL_027 TaxID=3345419 RepID=UPI003A8C6018